MAKKKKTPAEVLKTLPVVRSGAQTFAESLEGDQQRKWLADFIKLVKAMRECERPSRASMCEAIGQNCGRKPSETTLQKWLNDK